MSDISSKEIPEATRPDFEGYGISTESEGMLPWSFVEEEMVQARNYWICSTWPDGRPHAAPVWGVWVAGLVYFGSGEQSRKAKNLRANPEVVVHSESGDRAVIIEGRAEIRTHFPPELTAIINEQYAAKYDGFTLGEEVGGLFVVTPRQVFAWLEQDYPNTATRWRL